MLNEQGLLREIHASQASATAWWKPDPDSKVLDSTVGDLLRQQARLRSNRAALHWLTASGMATLSYAELLVHAENIARWMLSRVEPGSRVAIWARNSAEWVMVEYACALAGMNLTPWNTAWTDHEINQILAMTEPGIVFAGFDTRGTDLRQRAEQLAVNATVVALENVGSLTSDYSGALPAVTPDTPFLVQFTSGTTGRAKGAQLSHKAAVNGGYMRAVATAGTEADIYLNPTPLHHVAGSVSLVLGTLTIGASYFVMADSQPENLIRAARLSGATCFGGVPTMLIAMLEHPSFPKGQLRFRNLGSGGTQVPAALVSRLADEFQAIVSVGYGQSECPLISNTAQGDSANIIASTVGKPCAATEVKIVDPVTGTLCQFHQVGEICVRSPAMMSGYYNDPVATDQTIDADGFLHTGDLASMDENGYLRIQGRAREVIIRGGENIYPIQIEQALHQHPAVSVAAVVGVPDPKWGQQVGAVLRLVPGQTVSELELRDFLQTRLAHFNIPKYWCFVDSLPMTASGKVRKIELYKLF